MFARKYRLPTQIRLFHSHTIHTPLFMLKIAKNTFLYNRYGFVVGKAIDKRAVYRNRLKRRFRAIVEQMQIELKPGHDLLFVLKKPALGKTTEELQVEIKNVLGKQRLMKHF